MIAPVSDLLRLIKKWFLLNLTAVSAFLTVDKMQRNKKKESIMTKETEEDVGKGFTTMIDIVFLLLIFFILQPFKQPEQKVDSDLPKSGPSTISQAPRRNI